MNVGGRAQPFLVEIVGVAGSGKSTLTKVLCGSGFSFGLVDQMRLRSPRHLLRAARGFPRLVGPLTDLGCMHRHSWTDTKLFFYLEAWDSFIRESPTLMERKIAIADQGPVYALARLRTIEPYLSVGERYRKWRMETISRWSANLDLIVWLDAPDETLMVRINDREQAHVVKWESTDSAMGFIEGYRLAFGWVTEAIVQSGGPAPVRIDTSQTSREYLARDVGQLILAAADNRGRS